MPTPVTAQLEQTLLTVLVQLIVIIAAARLGGAWFRRWGQPQVCGEIAAGLVLGPSCFGRLFPGVFQNIFAPSVIGVFNLLSQVGLILLMFLIGLQFDFSHLRNHGRAAASISMCGVAAPFVLGFLLGRLLHAELGLGGSRLNFCLFLAAALSITAIPVLGRIMLELNIHRTRLGSLTISAAALDDVAGWTILALVTAFVRSQSALSQTYMIPAAIAYGALMLLAGRPWLVRWARRAARQGGGGLGHTDLAVLLILVLASSAVTNRIGIFSVFGAFLIGAALYDQDEFREAVLRRLNDFATVFFLPIFFTYTGLRTDVWGMQGGRIWMLCGLVLLAAVAGKFGGCALAARWNGMPPREASIVGALMNTRGLVALVVVNLGYDLGIIPRTVYFMLVLMAVATTYMTTPLLRRLIRRSELEEHFEASELARGAGGRPSAAVGG